MAGTRTSGGRKSNTKALAVKKLEKGFLPWKPQPPPALFAALPPMSFPIVARSWTTAAALFGKGASPVLKAQLAIPDGAGGFRIVDRGGTGLVLRPDDGALLVLRGNNDADDGLVELALPSGDATAAGRWDAQAGSTLASAGWLPDGRIAALGLSRVVIYDRRDGRLEPGPSAPAREALHLEVVLDGRGLVVFGREHVALFAVRPGEVAPVGELALEVQPMLDHIVVRDGRICFLTAKGGFELKNVEALLD
jgi:hypothetical protein